MARPDLAQLLRLAPNLRIIEIFSPLLVIEDVEQLVELVEQRACFRHLESLNVYLI